MDVCSGSNRDKHAEIAHTEGSTACPLCEMKAERDEFERENKKLSSEIDNCKAAHDAVEKELEILQQKTKHMTWAFEPVEEPKA